MSTEDDLDDDPLEPDDDDLGQPIDFAVLASAAVASSAFYERLRRRIERRQVTADFATLFWSLPGTVLRGLLAEGQHYLHHPPPTPGAAPTDEESPHG